MKARLSALAPPLILSGLLLGLWESVCRLGHVPIYLAPPPSAVLSALIDNAPALFGSAWVTLSGAVAALLLACAVALPLALVCALSNWVERAVRPLAVVLQVTPIIAVAPLVVIWAGLEHPERATTVLAALAAFFPLFSGALTGLTSADPDLERLFDLYGATGWQRLIRLRAPASTPFVLESFKVAVGLSVIGAVVAEFAAGSGGSQGLAWRIVQTSQQLRTAETFAALAALAMMAVALHTITTLAERQILRNWRGR
jgi:NitT/TauT family transport system permease protein